MLVSAHDGNNKKRLGLVLYKLIVSYYLLFWIAGLDGFIWFILAPFLLLDLFSNNRILLNKYVLLGLVFLIFSFIISFLFIEDSFRYLNFIRNTILILTIVLLITVVINFNIYDLNLNESLHKAIDRLIFYSTIIGVFSIVLNLDFSLKTPAFYVLPEEIISTDFGSRLVLKQLITKSWFAGFNYPRLTSLFQYAGSYGIVLSTMFIYVIVFHKKIKKYKVKLLLILVNILFTTSRTAIIALVISLLIYIFINRGILVKIALLILLSISIVLLLNLGFIEEILYARGEGSTYSRSTIYFESIKYFLINPLGYGEYVDIPRLDLPLGSHSTFIAILFKYGLIGVIGSILLVFGWIQQTKLSINNFIKVVPILVCIFLVFLFEEFYLDAYTGLLIGTIFALSISNETYKD